MSEAGQRWTSRKLVFALAVFLVSSLLLWQGLIDADVWLKISSADLLGYFTANVAQKATAQKEAT